MKYISFNTRQIVRWLCLCFPLSVTPFLAIFCMKDLPARSGMFFFLIGVEVQVALARVR